MGCRCRASSSTTTENIQLMLSKRHVQISCATNEGASQTWKTCRRFVPDYTTYTQRSCCGSGSLVLL